MAECAVKMVKNIFMKIDCMDDDAYLALLAHRATPSTYTNDARSSAEKLMSRNIRTPLPDLRKWFMAIQTVEMRNYKAYKPAYKQK